MSYQREFDKKIKIGVVGVGSHCYRNILPALNFLPVELKSICDINAELAAKTAAQYGNCNYYTSTAEMYKAEELDAVIISVSPFLHPRLAIEAFEAGLHVWLEKPVAVRAAEVEEMIKSRKDKVCVVGFKKAFMPSTDKAIEIINSDKYGNMVSILAIYPMSIDENGLEILEARKFTNWLGNGCHPLSFMIRLGGKVSAVTTIRSGVKGKSGGMCILEFENGVIGNLHLATGPLPNERYCVFGDRWHLSIDNCNKVTLQRGIPFDYGRTTSYLPEGDDNAAIVWEPQNCLATLENKALFTQGIYSELMYFCDCILNDKKPMNGSLEFALEIMKVYEAALLSRGDRVVIS